MSNKMTPHRKRKMEARASGDRNAKPGKGSGRRPGDESAYATNWDRIFGKKEEK